MRLAWVRPRVAVGLAIAVAALGGVVIAASARARPLGSAMPTVRITIHFSHFSPSVVSVPAGTTVRFVVDNTDPIDHEFIVGDEALQEQEEVSTETVHDGSLPGQISVPAGTIRSTTYTFGAPGSLIFACHVPGHYAYGMRGALRIAARI